MKIYIIIVGLLLPYILLAQTITGKVTNTNNEALFGANIFWINTTKGTTANEQGEFKISSNGITDKRLIASYVSHKPDTITISTQSFAKFELKDSQSLDEVVIRSKQNGIIISNRKPIKFEQITKTELVKAACCDLSGCFETQITVKPQTTNVITNSKELRILGLSGVYNQVLIDGFPMIQGLSHTYGISSIPGTLVDNIFISKGANSVLQGYESISGQINVITKVPDNTDKLLVNGYINSFAEKQLNSNYAFKKGKWSNITALHTVSPAERTDGDNDNFLDLPLLTRYMIFNKLKYGNANEWGWSSTFGFRFLSEKRIGGQNFFYPNTDKGKTYVYGQSVTLKQPEIWIKTGYRLNDKQNITLYTSSFNHTQKSYFGTVKYDAFQTNFYGNLQFELNYNTNNSLKTGLSYRHLNLNEDIVFTNNSLKRTYNGNYKRKEDIAGVFAENTMQFLNTKLTWIAGIRADHHNQFGFIFTPRTLLKYNITPKTILRANIGTGWRTVNLFSENIGLLVSSRDIIFAETLNPEKATNLGINITQKFKLESVSGFISADYYKTSFSNQIFPDYDSTPQKAIIKNFTDKSISKSYQAEFALNFKNGLEFKTGYTFSDVFREINGKKDILPFTPKYRSVTTFGYKPLSKKYQIDFNIHFYGKQRLPNTSSNPPEFVRHHFSKAYSTANTQFTYTIKQFELYTGCENIFNYRQKQPIISFEAPFSPYFDTSSVWGPTRGREFYFGFRYKIPN